jgi:hypothetical protein
MWVLPFSQNHLGKDRDLRVSLVSFLHRSKD